MARLLMCNDCCSLEKLPDYVGDARDDGALNYALRPHRDADGKPHRGNLLSGIPDAALENMAAREKIEKEIWGAKAEMATYKDTFVEDAGACFNRHQRPKLGCIDFRDADRRVSSPNTKGMKLEAKTVKATAVYLCDFCPVNSYVTSKIMDQHLWETEGAGRGRLVKVRNRRRR